MKRPATFKAIISIAIALTFAPGLRAASAAATNGAMDEHFSVREYNLFHDVLHHLQHEALPKKDFKTIRARAPELLTRGRAIVRLGVPTGVEDNAEFQKQLKQFDKALMRFNTDSRKKSDARLEESYTAVHDSFETLASMLPIRKSEG
ncbi:MAG: hypothetical protein QOF02_3024 [Blastocatellia bacterium]|nr:hypothetical protein [Blastocatellia bacterium]